VALGDQESLLNKDETIGGLSPQLHYKLYYNIQLHLIYFILLFLFNIPTFFALEGVSGIDWDMVFTAIHPFVIIIVVARAISIKA